MNVRADRPFAHESIRHPASPSPINYPAEQLVLLFQPDKISGVALREFSAAHRLALLPAFRVEWCVSTFSLFQAQVLGNTMRGPGSLMQFWNQNSENAVLRK